MTSQLDPKGNGLLAGLPEADYARILPELEPFPLELGKLLHRAGQPMHYVYFPVHAIVSIIYTLKNGDSAEVSVIGQEGVAGITLFMSGESTPNDAVVQHPGHSYRMHAQTLIQQFQEGGSLQKALLHFTQAYITQMSQTAVCNRHHSVDQQLCRWLLLSADRLPSNKVGMTHELIANMLGVRREGVTRALGVLVRAGLIANGRGWVTIRDRPGLEGRACECYKVVRNAYAHLLPGSSTGISGQETSG